MYHVLSWELYKEASQSSELEIIIFCLLFESKINQLSKYYLAMKMLESIHALIYQSVAYFIASA